MKTVGPPRRDSPIEIVHFADPWGWWSWGLEPILQRLREVYGDNVQVTYKMGGEFESLKGWMVEYGVDERGTVDWILESVALTRMPVRPDYYFRCRVESSFPACKAFKAAQLQSEDKATKYFRRMMEGFGLECLSATDDTLVKLGAEVGLDKDRLRKEMHSDAVEEAFERDRQEMLRHHANFDALLVEDREGHMEMKGATFSARPFEEIVDKLAPGLPKRSPADILEYLEHHKDLTPVQEIASVFRIPGEDAEMRLSKLERAGLLTRQHFDGIETWQWKGTLPCFDTVEMLTRQESGSLQLGEPHFGVFARNPEDGCDFLDRRQVLVMLQVLQDVRRAPLRKSGRELVDDLFERSCADRRAFHFHVSFTIFDEERVEVRMMPQHLLTIPLERLLHRVRMHFLSKPVFVEPNLGSQFHEGVIRGGETFEPEAFHHPTEVFRRLVLRLQLRRLERLACRERALDTASEVVIGPHRHARQRDGFENPVDRAPFVDAVFHHPPLQALEFATHLVRDLYVVTVDLSQTLKDRLQPPGPPAPRICEVDDLDRAVPTWRSHRFHRSRTWPSELAT